MVKCRCLSHDVVRGGRQSTIRVGAARGPVASWNCPIVTAVDTATCFGRFSMSTQADTVGICIDVRQAFWTSILTCINSTVELIQPATHDTRTSGAGGA